LFSFNLCKAELSGLFRSGDISRGGAKQPTLGEGVSRFVLKKVVFFSNQTQEKFLLSLGKNKNIP
jgi:hypothetical protein